QDNEADRPGQQPSSEGNKSHLDRFDDPLPTGAIARFGTVRFRQGQYIFALAFSPNSRMIASGGRDRVVRLFDATTGKVLRVFRGHENDVTALAFFPDGQRLASGGADSAVCLWDLATGKQESLFVKGQRRGFEDRCRFSAVAFSPDGTLLAAGSSANEID